MKYLLFSLSPALALLALSCGKQGAEDAEANSESLVHEHEHSHDHDYGHGHDHGHGPGGASENSPANSDFPQVVAATPNSPEFLRLASGIQLIDDIDAAATHESATFTHEGTFAPLLFTEGMRAFRLKLDAGMFLSEHPHPAESLIFTVRGQWVLCSEGNRQVMKAGSLFHFGSDAPTGWEAPFEGGAELLIVKTLQGGESYESSTTAFRDLATKVDEGLQNGDVFYFRQLADDHPAITFAKENNPDFETLLEQWKREGDSNQ